MATKPDRAKRPKAKPTWTDVKAKLGDFDRAGLVQLVADLYAFHKDNQAFMHARFGLGQNPLDDYKKRIAAALAPDIDRKPRAQVSVATARKAISEYTKAVGDPMGVLELRVFWCETAVGFSMEYAFTDTGYLDALALQYREACGTLSALKEPQLEEYIERLQNVRDDADMGYGVDSYMNEVLGDAMRKLPPSQVEARIPMLGED